MSGYVQLMKVDKYVSVCLYIEQDKVFEIGEKMNKLHELAYMNGYNWEAFFNHYLEKNNPELLDGFGSDPEAGMYVAYYDLTAENEAKANSFMLLIKKLIENESLIYDYMRENGDEIEWD